MIKKNILKQNFLVFSALVAELPPDEASKIKVAFAEGYIAANPTNAPPTTRTYRWLRTLQQVLAIAVFTAILASLMGTAKYLYFPQLLYLTFILK